jgi:RNA polymerase sigma-70 factor (ECF subfamily)
MPADPQDFETYRSYLFSIAYRMLGSAMEAEDMLQEAYLRYQGVPASEVRSPKAYLGKIVTRLCLDQLKSARLRRENYYGSWLPEPIPTGKSPSAALIEREAISTAFLVLLERLSPVERAVFLLREVFDYPYNEIAELVGRSQTNCRQYDHRARRYIHQHRPRFEPSYRQQEQLVESFLNALTSGDVDGMIRLLAEQAVLYGDGGGKVPSISSPLTGRGTIVKVLLGFYRTAPPETRVEIFEINGAPGLLVWQGEALLAVITFEMADGQIQSIYNVINPDKFAYLTTRPGLSD